MNRLRYFFAATFLWSTLWCGTADAIPTSGRERLLSVMDKYSSYTHVPYVWGGGSIGTPTECDACRECIAGKKRLAVERRLKACEPCQRCGIDCSHFVHTVYAEAGLELPYVTTRDLRRSSMRMLRDKFQLIEVRRKLDDAVAGDLLLHPKHVVMLLELRPGGRGDILHASRSNVDGGVGGVEVLRDQDLRKFRGRLVKVLRHRSLWEGPLPELPRTMKAKKTKKTKKTKSRGDQHLARS